MGSLDEHHDPARLLSCGQRRKTGSGRDTAEMQLAAVTQALFYDDNVSLKERDGPRGGLPVPQATRLLLDFFVDLRVSSGVRIPRASQGLFDLFTGINVFFMQCASTACALSTRILGRAASRLYRVGGLGPREGGVSKELASKYRASTHGEDGVHFRQRHRA
ncbi:hypothetical protein DENSPDRAFT_71682 [Dentipellis sp. KUC8613]|nr:hypothetical protein DENSPDRAFT_71682 [Dentipellis sp. KUC8613]